jgi:hypothetical protein
MTDTPGKNYTKVLKTSEIHDTGNNVSVPGAIVAMEV